jgi:urease accessory protein
MKVAHGIRGNVHEDDALHDEYHDHEAAGTLERVVVDATTRRRSRFRTTTESGTDLGVVVDASEGLRPGDVLAVDDSEHLFVVEFEAEDAVVVDLPDSEAGAEVLAAAVAFGHVVGNKHWDLAVDGGRVYVRVGADGPRVADELRSHLLDGATLSHERVDPTLFDSASSGGDHSHGSGQTRHGGHTHDDGHTHGEQGHDDHTHPVARPTEDSRE